MCCWRLATNVYSKNSSRSDDLWRSGNPMSFSEHDLHQVGAALAVAARTEIMPRFGKLRANEIRQKSSAIDVVTDADEAAERAICEALGAAFPGAPVVGEEGSYRDPTLLQQLSTAELAFIVDPIDGTKNFV